MTYTPKPPEAPRDPESASAPAASRMQGAWGTAPNDADLTVPDLADDALDGADAPLLFIAEDEIAAADARAMRDEEALLAANDTDDGEDETVPPTDAGTIAAVADADTVWEAANLELSTEITATDDMTDAEMIEAVGIAAAMHDAVVESAISDALDEAAQLAAETGEPVIVVVEDEIVGIASPEDLSADAEDTGDAGDAMGMTDDPGAAAGVFGDNIAAFATSADDPLVQMLNVRKPDPAERDMGNTPRFVTDTAPATGAIGAIAPQNARMDGDGNTLSAPGASTAGTGDAAPGIFGENITAYATDADDPAMRMLNVRKSDPLDRDEGRDTLPADVHPASEKRESDPLDEGGMVTMTPEPDDTDDAGEAQPLLDETTEDIISASENDPEPAVEMETEDPAPLMSEEMLDVVEDNTLTAYDDDLPIDTADESDTPPAPEPTVQFVAGDTDTDDALTVHQRAQAREDTGSSVSPPAPATSPPDEPPGELTEEELEQARTDTEGGENAPESGDEEPTSGQQSQSQSQSQSFAGAASGTNTETAAPAREATALTTDELAQASMDNDSGIATPERPATDRDGNEPFTTSHVWHTVPLMTADDLYLFNEGTHTRLYEKLGSRPRTVNGVDGTHFAVWAPNARTVSVVGPFNDWVGVDYDLARNGASGIWEGFIPGLGAGTSYKYHISSNYNMYEVDKTDPFGIYAEMSPRTASVVWDEGYVWQDDDWMRERGDRNRFDAPMSVYEVHLGSWRRVPEDGNRPLTYGELAPQLADYVQECGFTHVEFMPVMEHPFYGSWGYQVTGYFAPTSRYGTPQDFAYLVDYLHQRGIGVILDWVPSHFPTDQHGLDYFDGTHLYEHADPRQGFHPDWKSDVFNYGRNEVRSFLMSSATYWLDRFHADGLRVDGVASMLYLDYSRNPGEWVPNRHGGRENLEAVSLLKQLNTAAYSQFPDTQTTAEESTSWPMVSRPTYIGGLGFGMKWDMGWMHDTLEYMSLNPIHRQFHHNALTFRMLYAYFENFVLPLSHDEVVYLKGSLIQKMGGDDDWQKFANLRLLFGYQWAQSGKKLLFMGGEFAQWGEWNHDTSLDWHLLDHAPHQGIKTWISDLNRLYRDVPALHQRDFDRSGFEWIDANDSAQSMASFIRYGDDREDPVVIAANFTPVPRYNYRLGVPFAGRWNEILNSDATQYGGSGSGNMGGADAVPAGAHGRPQSLTVTVPPLGIVFFRRAYGS